MAERERVTADEVEQIQPRVGRSPADRLQWALDFAQKDLNTLTVGDWANLRRELAAFRGFTVFPTQVKNRRVLNALLELGRHNWGSQTFVELPMEEQTRQAQAEFRRIVDRLLTRGMVAIGPHQVTHYVSRLDKTQIPPERRASLSTWTRGASPGLEQFTYLLGAYAALVGVCPEPKCQRWFVAGRTNQTYCSTRCQTRATTRTYRERMKKPPQPSKHARKGGRA